MDAPAPDASAPDAPTEAATDAALPPLSTIDHTQDDAINALQAKNSARGSRTTTPRANVVFPDALADAAPVSARPSRAGNSADERAAATLSSRSNPRSIPLSARKYAVADSAGRSGSNSGGLAPPRVDLSATPGAPGLPSAPASASTRLTAPQYRPSLLRFAPNRASFRGSVRVLARELPRSITKAARSSKRAYRHATLQQVIAYALLLSGMLSEAFTPAPRHNTPLGVLLFVVPAAQFPHRLVVSGLGTGVLVDVYWLLRPQELSFNGHFANKFVHAAQLALAACALVKLWLIFSAYFDLDEVEEEQDERQARRRRATTSPLQPGSHRLWDQVKYVFPRKTLPKRSHLSFEVLMRVLALVWIHGVLGVLLLALALTAASSHSTRPQFRSKPLGLPLPIAMLLKAATTLLAYFCATHRMSYRGCLGLTVGGITGFRASREDVVLKYNKVWLQRVQRAKALDTLAGLYALLALFMASHRGEGVATPAVQVLLAVTAVALLILELWTPLLVLTVAKCGARLHELHRLGEDGVDDPYFPNQIQWSDEEDDDSDDDDDDDDGSDDDASDGDDVSEDAEDDSDGDSTRRVSAINLRERQRRRNRGQRGEGSSRRFDQTRRPSRRQLLREEDDDDEGSEEDWGGRRSGRRASLVIVDAVEVPRRDGSESTAEPVMSGPVWVRHLDPSSRRPFLVHSVTGESVWEIVSPRGEPGAYSEDGAEDIRAKAKTSARSVRHAISRPESSRSRNAGSSTGRRNVESVPSEQQLGQEQQEAPTVESDLSSDVMFSHEWYALGVDSGAFLCRVSRIPGPSELAAHLGRQGFATASDGIVTSDSGDLRRVARFWAPVGAEEGQTRFLGEFTFDSLALTLRAAFRCARADAVVEFVRRLQLKEIVGAYSPIAAGSG